MTMKKTLFICTCAVVAAGILDLQAGTYYVSTNGNDSNSGTSWDTALRTPNAGFRKVHNNQSKDKLIIGPGHYILSDACACAGLTYGDEICGSTGQPRISGHGVDIGCYEVFVPHGMSISIK